MPPTLDLFAECPAPEPAMERPRRPRSAPASGSSVATLSLAPQVSQRAAVGAIREPDLEPLEAIAQRLERDPNYRVLRKLQPRETWPAVEGADLLTLLVLDTETTGLDNTRERIIELGMLRLSVDRRSGMPVGNVKVFDGLEDPGKPIPAEVVAITGITDDKVAGQRLDEKRIADMLQGVDLVVAHNAGFDRPFVEARLPAFADLEWACSFADVDWKQRGRSSAKLENLALDLGLFYDAHRADIDCQALLAVLTQGGSESRPSPMQELLAAASRTKYRVWATRSPFETKDQLKARGYRWNAENKVWGVTVASDEALELEQDWLRANIYGARGGTIEVEALDALTRYSSRSGTVRTVRL